MTAELVAHRGQQLVGEIGCAARAEALVKRRCEHVRRHSLVDRRIDRPSPLARIGHPACEIFELWVGQKKILVIIQDRDQSKSLTPKAYVGITESNAGAMPGWSKAGTGHWELRTTDIIDARWIPSQGSYCFTHRVFYVDHEKLGFHAAENRWPGNIVP